MDRPNKPAAKGVTLILTSRKQDVLAKIRFDTMDSAQEALHLFSEHTIEVSTPLTGPIVVYPYLKEGE